MISYFIEVNICWLVFLSLFMLFFQKETFHHSNRFYLIITLLLGVVIPLLEIPTYQQYSNVWHEIIEVGLINETPMVEANHTFSLLSIGSVIYCFVGILLGFKLLYGIFQIWKLTKASQSKSHNGYILIENKKHLLPFSFFKFLFWNPEYQVDEVEKATIIRHELAHIKGFHSIDILLSEIACILFWCSPLVYFYKKAIRDNHEFIADAAVLETTKIQSYGTFLLAQNQGLQTIPLANHFIQSQLKKRILMMTKTNSQKSAGLKYLIFLPALFGLCMIFSCQNVTKVDEQVTTTQPSQKSLNTADANDVYSKVDEMPRFPGCENFESYEEKKDCGTKKMLEYIYKNVKYPKEARELKIEGTVVIRFIVGKDGIVKNPEILRSIGGGCEEEVLRIMNKMKEEVTWIPGFQNNEAVNVYFNLPVKFKLQ